jgi:glutamine---fructose-6-phosphate transaminase (isomerizing)
MCGILGYVGSEAAWNIVLGGLRRLEYRGYDSAGVVTLSREKLRLARRVGHLRVLEEDFPDGLPGTIGIGHTRWATHGGVTEANCHPHLDSKERIALVHNGIIDNVETLRAKLVAEGVQFRSETDTEVLAELIGRGVEAGLGLRDAVVEALKKIEGTAGIVVMDRLDPQRLVAARIGSPVVIGLGEGQCWVASDAIALRPYTDRMVVLDDSEIAELTPTSIKTVDLEQRSRDKRVEKILHQPEEADIGSYAHFMLKEIHEQPLALDRSMRGRLDAASGSSRLGGLETHAERLFDIQRNCGYADRATRDSAPRRAARGHHQRGRQLALARNGLWRVRARGAGNQRLLHQGVQRPGAGHRATFAAFRAHARFGRARRASLGHRTGKAARECALHAAARAGLSGSRAALL